MLQEIYDDIKDLIKIPFNKVYIEAFKFKVCAKNHVPLWKVFANLVTNCYNAQSYIYGYIIR